MSREGIHLQIATEEQTAALFDLINEAYKVENGETGVGFKKEGELRFSNHDEVINFIKSGNMTVAFDKDTSEVVGCIYTLTIFSDGEERLYFGPLASKRRGVGKILLEEAERIAVARGCKSIEISVINIRTDVLPWYLKNGYVVVGEKPYPKPGICTREVHFLILRKSVTRQ